MFLFIPAQARDSMTQPDSSQPLIHDLFAAVARTETTIEH